MCASCGVPYFALDGIEGLYTLTCIKKLADFEAAEKGPYIVGRIVFG